MPAAEPAAADATGRSLWAPRAWLGGRLARRRVAARRARRPLGRGRARRHRAARERRARRPGLARPRRRPQPRVPARVRRPRRARERAPPAGPTTSGRGASACTRVALRITPDAAARDRGAALRRAAARRLHAGLRVPLPAARRRTARPTPTRATLAWALADAAADAGIGLTMLPVLYERAGFADPALRARPAPLREHAPTSCCASATRSAPPRGRSSTPASRSIRCAPHRPRRSPN